MSIIRSNFGVNVLGYLKYDFGIAQLGKLIIACLEHAKIPYVANNFETFNHNLSTEDVDNVDDDNIYPVNIVVINAREMKDVINKKGETYFLNKYNIGIWCW